MTAAKGRDMVGLDDRNLGGRPSTGMTDRIQPSDCERNSDRNRV